MAHSGVRSDLDGGWYVPEDMACLDENDVVSFLARTMPNARLTEVEAHLADCQDCRELLAASAEDKPRVATVPLQSAVDPLEPTSDAAELAERAPSLAQRLSLAQARSRIGTTLGGKWTIDGFIGVGGMAHVFSGTHRNGRKVAIKILRPELAVEPELVRRFLREGYVANRVGHPGAVAVLDDDIAEDGAPFLVMELLVGETLKDRIGRSGPIPLDEALRLADECLAVFAAAHAQGVVHRDIKPDNLFLTDDGHIKVLDFGIARLRESTQPIEAHTRAGQMIGTPGYMAPEQARGRTEAIDARTDVWALGATIFAMLAGHPLQRAETVQELLSLAITTPVDATSETSPHVPVAVGHVLDKALSFGAEDRFPDAAAMRIALREAAESPNVAIAGAPVEARPASAHPYRMRLAWLGLPVLALLGYAFASSSSGSSSSNAPPPLEPAVSVTPDSGAPPNALAPSSLPAPSLAVPSASAASGFDAATPSVNVWTSPQGSVGRPRKGLDAAHSPSSVPQAVPSVPEREPDRDPLGPRR